jgi:hypothetical protein
MKKFSQAGFSHHLIIGLIVFLAIVGFAGYKVVTMNRTATPTSSTAADSKVASDTLKTQADLTATGKELDADSDDINSSLNDTQLDADLNAML